jgi:KilA-N domain
MVEASNPNPNMIESLLDQSGNPVDIEIRLSDFFVNATRVCSSYGKSWMDFRQLPETLDFLSDFDEDVVVIDDTHRNSCVAWVHPDLAIELLAWCNRKFRVAGAKIIRRYMIGRESKETARGSKENIVNVRSNSSERTSWVWHKDRVDAMEIHHLLSDKIQTLLNDNFEAFNMCVDIVNRATADLTETTSSFLKRHGAASKRLSFPDVCDERMLRRHNFIKSWVQSLLEEHIDELRSMSRDGVCDWLRDRVPSLHSIARDLGYHRDARDRIMSVDESVEKKKVLATRRRTEAIPTSSTSSTENLVEEEQC